VKLWKIIVDWITDFSVLLGLTTAFGVGWLVGPPSHLQWWAVSVPIWGLAFYWDTHETRLQLWQYFSHGGKPIAQPKASALKQKVRGLRLPWRKSKAPAEGVDFDGLDKLLQSNALCIRAARNPDTLDLYFRMMAAPSEAASSEEGTRLSGQLFYELTAAFA
jgi:hypothetical protein